MKLELVGAVLALALAGTACGRSTRPGEAAGGTSGSGSAAGSGAAEAGVAGVGGGSGTGGLGIAGEASAEGGVAGAAGNAEGGVAENGEGGAGGSGDERCEPTNPDEQCVKDRQLTLAPFEIVDESGDGQVSAGEGVTLKSVLSNPGPEDHNWYPGVLFTVSDPDVEPAMGGWHNLFALGVGQSYPFELAFEMPADAPAGSVVTIGVVPSSINPQAPCCGQHARQIELVIAQ